MRATDRPNPSLRGRPRTAFPLRALLAAAVLGLAFAAPQPAAAQFGDIMKGMIPGMAGIPGMPGSATPAPSSRPASSASASASAPGPMGLQAPTALPPLHRLGTDAVAVVDAASPKAPVHEMDYVFAKQTIALGPAGKLTLSYLSGCLTESIIGGTVTVAQGGSKVAGGKKLDRATPGCRAAHPIVLASASEAGATVNRITPFSAANWDERTLKSGPPVFKWDMALSASTVQVKDMDKPGQPVIWQGPAPATGWVALPVKAVILTPGEPYKAEAVASGGAVVASALFSLDPALDVADSLANRVVPLSKP
jgi:hypothetical protein